MSYKKRFEFLFIRSGRTKKLERLKLYQEALEALVRLSFALLISLPCEPTFSIYPVFRSHI